MALETFGRHLAQLIVAEVCAQLDNPVKKHAVIHKSSLVLADSMSQKIIEDALFSVYTISRYKFYKGSRLEEPLQEEPEECSDLDRTSDGGGTTDEAPTLPLLPQPQPSSSSPPVVVHDAKMQQEKIQTNQEPSCGWNRILSTLCCIKTASRSNSVDVSS